MKPETLHSGVELKKRRHAQKLALHILAVKRNATFSPLKRHNVGEEYGRKLCRALGRSENCSKLDSRNFNRSGAPCRFMYLTQEQREWEEFPVDANFELCQRFKAGCRSVEISANGESFIVNFLGMFRLNLVTGCLQSIAWIDENDKCFFPSEAFEGHLTLPIHKRVKPQEFQSGSTAQRDDESSSEVCDSYRIFSTGESGVVSDFSLTDESELTADWARLKAAASSSLCDTRNGFASLTEVNQEGYGIVKTKLKTALGFDDHRVIVSGIYANSFTSMSGQVRYETFSIQEKVTRTMRGHANVRWAWYKASKADVYSIILHGFGLPQSHKNDAMYGVGVYLIPENHSFLSAVSSDGDENREEHVILCRVILGNIEQVNLDSQQYHPSSEQYDTGIDDYNNPTCYIVWTTHMNTHIIPEYVISYKVSSLCPAGQVTALGEKQAMVSSLLGHQRLDGVNGGARRQFAQSKTEDIAYPCSGHPSKDKLSKPQSAGCFKRVPRSPWMSFPVLFMVLQTKLQPSDLAKLRNCHMEFKAGKMPREMLIKNVRSVAGDSILAECIRSMQQQRFRPWIDCVSVQSGSGQKPFQCKPSK